MPGLHRPPEPKGPGKRLSATLTLCACRTGSLILVPAPTPRWPDLLCAYSRTHKMMFTSKLFCAHVSQTAIAQGAVADEGGWDVYGRDWQHYFDCMLAPVARQASSTPCSKCVGHGPCQYALHAHVLC